MSVLTFIRAIFNITTKVAWPAAAVDVGSTIDEAVARDQLQEATDGADKLIVGLFERIKEGRKE